MEVYLRYWMYEYSVQFPTNLTPTTATTKNLSIVNPETTARDAMRVSTWSSRTGEFSQFITELEYLVADWLAD